MFLQSDPVESPHPNGAMAGLQTTVQRLGRVEREEMFLTFNMGVGMVAISS